MPKRSIQRGRPTGTTTYEAEPAIAFGAAVREERTNQGIAQETLAHIWVVWRRLLEQRIRAGEQVAVQPARLARPRDFAGPDVQPARLLAVLSQLLEALLHPLPPLQLLLLG